jgi:hypothetical protein
VPDRDRRIRRNRKQAKDRVLQARIPEQLDEELRNRAEQLGLSVSTIVRNVLLHTFDLVEGVVTDSSQIARALTGWDAGPSDPNAEPKVIGWQEAILNRNGVCEQCNVILPAGHRAAIGVPAGSRATLLCLECLSVLSSSTGASAGPPAQKKGKKRTSKSTSAGLKSTDG